MAYACAMRRLAIVFLLGLALAVPAGAQSLRPEFPGTHAVVAAGRTYTAEAGAELLSNGGTAVDAGIAAIFAAAVVEISHFGLGGEAPMVIYLAKSREVVVINGQGTAPMAATPAAFAGKTSIPANGPLAATIPAVVDAASLALAKYGTKSLGEVLAPAIRLADGFPMYEFLSRYLASERRGCEPYAATMRTYYPEGRVTKAGEMFRQPNLARTLRRLVEAEAASLKAGEPREKAIGRARDAFYTGDIARQLAAAVQAEGGMITEADLANYHSKIEQPYSVTYRGYTVHKAGPWNQSPVLLQTLNLLEGFDLRCDGPPQRGQHPRDDRGDEARVRRSRSPLRRPGVREGADDRPVVEGLRGEPARAHRPDARQPRAAARQSAAVRWTDDRHAGVRR